MRLFHGTNRRIKNLRKESFLTANTGDAVFFAHLKEGGVVYEFEVNENQVYRDLGTMQKEWYLSNVILQPINRYSC